MIRTRTAGQVASMIPSRLCCRDAAGPMRPRDRLRP
jgi:hypothetical protein